jgi:hypothetical protein
VQDGGVVEGAGGLFEELDAHDEDCDI